METVEDFPLMEFEPYEKFEILFEVSKKRTYDVVKKNQKKRIERRNLN